MCLSSFFYEVTELSAANTTILWSVVRRRKSHPGKEKARERLCGLEQSAGALDGRAWGNKREGGAETSRPDKTGRWRSSLPDEGQAINAHLWLKKGAAPSGVTIVRQRCGNRAGDRHCRLLWLISEIKRTR